MLYGTSTLEQLSTTDVRAADGTVDGLGEFNRPNASAKTTIFLGARMYIELLQKRVSTLQRKVDELESFRSAVAGPENLQAWKDDFDRREAVIAAAAAAAESAKLEQDSLDEEDESEEEEPKRKKAKVVKAPRVTKAAAAKAAKGDVKPFAAFAITFSLLPSASTLFGSHQEEHVAQGHTFVRNNATATTSEVVRRLPLITAEHVSRLLARTLPAVLTPSPTALVDWTWRLLLAAVFALIIRSFLGRRSTKTERKSSLGSLPSVATDTVKAYLSLGRPDEAQLPALVALASQVVGGVVDLPRLSRYHLAIRLGRVADDAQSLALLALLQSPAAILGSGSATKIWASARDATAPSTPPALQQVLALTLSEARRALALLPPTPCPLTAMSEQITLVHLNELYTRFFVHLVNTATTGGQSVPDSIKDLLANLENKHNKAGIAAGALESFDNEIRSVVEGVPKGTAAYSLGLVLIGLWGLLNRPSPSAQAALASALAGEEIRGVGASLASVSALRELLYPGSRITDNELDTPLVALPRNATTLDRLALVCIQFIDLLATSASVTRRSARKERLEQSINVQKATMDIRLALSSTTFVGLDAEEEGEVVEGQEGKGPTGDRTEVEVEFEYAREKLVSVLSVVGRRAAGRASGRDLDSGVEGDIDEL